MKLEFRKLKWWQWIFVIGLFPFTISIFIWQKKEWSQNKKLKVLGTMWVIFVAFGVYQELHPSSPPKEIVISQNTSASQLETKKDESAAINQQLLNERKTYDTQRGNNLEAANTAQALVDLVQTVSPSNDFDAYIRLEAPDKEAKKYELGGDAQEYRNAVSFVGLTIVIDSSMWSSANDDQKKNLIASWAKMMEKQYPNAGGWMKVTNGLRDVAEANWLGLKYDKLEIELK